MDEHGQSEQLELELEQHSMAAQQAAAKDYQPVLEGPLVGDKMPCDAIAHEYAKADPIYVEKTVALPQTYSHYRPIQGDGNCGWRAIGFAYFETLIDAGDQARIEGEVARLMSYNQMLADVGGFTYFEEWAEEVTDLLREVAAAIATPALAHIILLRRWNDAAVTAGIIYYLRMLAATYLRANADTYDPFVPDGQGIQGFCRQSIEPINHEIEHLGIVALVNILLKPVNFVLEIAYLDRSQGAEVNKYRFPEEANGQDPATLGPMIHLLYRPDHYDILYQAPIPPPPPQQQQLAGPPGPVSLQVHRVTGFSHAADIADTPAGLGGFSSLDFGTLAMIPGFNPGGAGLSPLSPPGTSSMASPFTSTQQQSPWMPQFPDELQAMAAQPQPIVAQGPATPSTPISPNSSLGTGPPMMGATGGVGVQPGVAPAPSLAPESCYHIRFSPVQLEYDDGQGTCGEPFHVTTSTFKNSVWNRAHYGNPDFHPEEWLPEDSQTDRRVGSRRKTRRAF